MLLKKKLTSIIKRYITIILLTLLTAIAVYRIEHNESIENKKLFQFPLQIGAWAGHPVPMEDWVYESLETPYAILRNYQSPSGENINFTVVWYDDKEIAFHSPAACLGSSGDNVKEHEVYSLEINNQSSQIGKLLTDKYDRRYLVLYYYISDGIITGTSIQTRIEIIKKKLMLKRTSAAFIRIMMPIVNNSQERTKDTLERFLLETLPLVIEYTTTEYN